MTLTWPKTLFPEKTLILSKTVDKTNTKMLQNDVRYETAMKASYFFKE